MKKVNIVSLFIVGALLFTFATSVAAVGVTPIPVQGGYSLTAILGFLVNAMLLIGGAMAVVMFIWAGITFLIANGNPEKIAQARMAFLWGVAGVVVMLLGGGIVGLVQGLLTSGT